MSPFIYIGICLSLALQVLDQSTDIFAVILFYFEGNLVAAILTLGFVLLPGICIGLAEIKRACSRDLSLLKGIGYILFAPLWAIVIHLYSLFDQRYVPTALFFKSMQGFLESGPQATLQLSLLFHGYTSKSKQMLISPYLHAYTNESSHHIEHDYEDDYDYDEAILTTTPLPTLFEDLGLNGTTELPEGSISVFGRIYDKEDRYWFGWIHTLSVIISFISIFITSISFNELEAKNPSPLVMVAGDLEGVPATPVIDTDEVGSGKCENCSSRGFAKLCFGIPFLLFTLIFRIVGLALLITFLQVWSGVIIFILFFLNVLTALFIGDNFIRATAYGIWSLLVPVGYNRDPTAHFGYKKVPLVLGHSYTVNDEELITEKDIARSQVRSKYFLTVHVLTSIFVLGSCLIFTFIIIHSDPAHYYEQTVLTPEVLSYICLPILGFSLGASVLLARPYYRCDCSGGEIPSGNIIV